MIRHGFVPLQFGWLGWLFPLLVLALLAGVAVMLVLGMRRRPEPALDGDPLRRAARRYANGELERVEFERIQRDLGGSPEDPVRVGALRLARGEITVAQFDELRSHLAPGNNGPMGENDAKADQT